MNIKVGNIYKSESGYLVVTKIKMTGLYDNDTYITYDHVYFGDPDRTWAASEIFAKKYWREVVDDTAW